MTTHDLFFAIIGVICLAAALLAVTTKHILHSALWLTVSLGALAGCYLVLGAEFVALVQLIVYVGAVVVLVLFALMLTRAPIGRSVAHDTPRVQRAAAFVLATATATLIGAALITGFGTESVNLRPNTTEQLATQIFATWSWPFELLSLLLLIALVSALALSRLRVGEAPDDDDEVDA